ncbi:MAG: 1-(5-phosphoribosyl)-5-[Clostridia bacterium]|nr:1-(5-phosphoribosyl)-5-[(5-phosphoribosylamino)methylideneamino]imidazole-4-carboxamide isomerase [Clostridia bacterium]
MNILPAIDIQGGKCVRLYRGDFATAHTVAEDAVQTALAFEKAGARYLHTVDLDGARTGRSCQSDVFLRLAKETGLRIELGGGIRDMQTLERYFAGGIYRCVLGSAALKDPEFVRQAVRAYGRRIAVGIDARDGVVAAEGWTETSSVTYLELARRMEDIGVQVIIFTDIGRDGMLSGPNTEQLAALSAAVRCDIIASGGMRDVQDVRNAAALSLYGAICGKSLYSGSMDLAQAIRIAEDDVDRMAEPEEYFAHEPLLPAVIQEEDTGDVLMLAYMNSEALRRTLRTGETWFWSRSRRCYWHKGETSGHVQKVTAVYGDCDRDTLLIKVRQTGAACHTGAHSCFFRKIGG